MTIKADIEALERALEAMVDVSKPAEVRGINLFQFKSACSPEVIRRLLDERAKALSLLDKALRGIDAYWSPDMESEIRAFLAEAGHE